MITKELENLEGMLHASVSYASGLVIVALIQKSFLLTQSNEPCAV